MTILGSVTEKPTGMMEPLFKKLARFEPLKDAERELLSSSVSRVVDYSPGETIVEEDSSPVESCVLLEGFAGRTKVLPGGGRQILAIHIAGDFCDLHSFLLPQMDHSIQSFNKCRIAKVPHERIAEITERLPKLARAMWWDTALDAAIHRAWMVSMGRRTAYEQVAHLLCEMFLRLGVVGLVKDKSFDFPVTQEQLGDAFGLSAVHVNRMLQALRRGELIHTAGRRITIPDITALKEAAGFDPTYLERKGRSTH